MDSQNLQEDGKSDLGNRLKVRELGKDKKHEAKQLSFRRNV